MQGIIKRLKKHATEEQRRRKILKISTVVMLEIRLWDTMLPFLPRAKRNGNGETHFPFSEHEAGGTLQANQKERRKKNDKKTTREKKG